MQLLHISHASRSGVQLYLLLLFLRVLLSWFPAFNWERQPWLTLRQARPALRRLRTPDTCLGMRPVHSLASDAPIFAHVSMRPRPRDTKT